MTSVNDIATKVAALLVARGDTLAVSESSAGGLVSAALLAVPGASRFFLGGAVVYTATAREALLGITPAAMAGLRSASEPYAELLAATVIAKFGSVWALAETGATGPAGNRYGDPAGHACLAVAGPVRMVRTLRTGSADRTANMDAFTVAALTLLAEALEAA